MSSSQASVEARVAQMQEAIDKLERQVAQLMEHHKECEGKS